jgi:hypothetical protein
MKKTLLILIVFAASLSLAHSKAFYVAEKNNLPPDSVASFSVQNGGGLGATSGKLKSNNTLEVFPNPVVVQSTIKYQIENGIGEVRIYNLLGTLVRTIPLQEKQGVTTLRASDYKSGIYFCSLEVNGRVVETKKIVVK